MRRVGSMLWEREKWVLEYEGGERIAEIARRHEVSRRTVHKWIARHAEFGEEGLRELSRAPHEHANAVDAVWRERVRAVRQEHPRWGAPKLLWELEQRYGGEEVPSESTIGRLLREMGLSRMRKNRMKAHGTGPLWEAQQANEVWSVDFKGWCRTRDGMRCEPLTISDQASRYLLCCQALESQRTELVRPVMARVFRDCGVPERIRSDNGSPFASQGGCGLTELSVWWIELGIVWERIEPGRPQQNGRHERMHRTLKEETMQPPAATLRQQQRRMEEFQREYNERRPHQALGQRVPASMWKPAWRAYRERVREPEYESGWVVRKIEDGGQASWSKKRMFVSHALRGKRVGFEPLADGMWRLWFYRQWLGIWDERSLRLWRPHEVHRQKGLRSPAGLAPAPLPVSS